MGNLDANFNPSIFRKDNPIILACDRHLATILPVRLRYKSGGYSCGEVVARNTTDGLYDSYASGGSSGLNVAAGVLFLDIDFGAATAGSQPTPCIFSGRVYSANLVGSTTGALANLNARTITDATGTAIVIF